MPWVGLSLTSVAVTSPGRSPSLLVGIVRAVGKCLCVPREMAGGCSQRVRLKPAGGIQALKPKVFLGTCCLRDEQRGFKAL